MITARTILLLIVALPGFSEAQGIERRIAITFDDLPGVSLPAPDPAGLRKMTDKLLDACRQRNIPLIGFVNESKLYEDGELVPERVDVLRRWPESGFELGNHTFSHPDLHRVPVDEFQADILRGETTIRTMLSEFGQQPRYFRHPYLHTGIDLGTRTTLENFLGEHGYAVAPVTIDNSEWIFARAYLIALRRGDEEMAKRIGADYIAYMLEMVSFYEGQSERLFGRNIAHVMLVHANQLNADWFGALADALQAIGYEFVTLATALEDPAYRSADTYTGPGGITWLHRWAITRDSDPSMFAGEPTTPDYVLELTRLPEHAY